MKFARLGTLISALTVFGCSSDPPTIRDWVSNRGYIYLVDFSQREVIGKEVSYDVIESTKKPRVYYRGDTMIRDNRKLSFTSQSSGAGTQNLSFDRSFRIEGASTISKFFGQLGNVEATGRISSASNVILKLDGISQVNIGTVYPRAATEYEKTRYVAAVSKVLRVTDLSFSAYRESGAVLKAGFKATRDASGKTEVELHSKTVSTIEGANIMVGYDFECYQLLGVDKPKRYRIGINKTHRFPGVLVRILGTRRATDGQHEAVGSFSPSSFVGAGEVTDLAPAEPAKEESKENKGAEQPGTAELFSVARARADDSEHLFLTTTENLLVRATDKIGIPIANSDNAAFLQIDSVESDKLVLTTQRVEITVVNWKKCGRNGARFR